MVVEPLTVGLPWLLVQVSVVCMAPGLLRWTFVVPSLGHHASSLCRLHGVCHFLHVTVDMESRQGEGFSRPMPV